MYDTEEIVKYFSAKDSKGNRNTEAATIRLYFQNLALHLNEILPDGPLKESTYFSLKATMHQAITTAVGIPSEEKIHTVEVDFENYYKDEIPNTDPKEEGQL